MKISNTQLHKNLVKAIEELDDHVFFFMDMDGQVATWNLGAQNIKGYTASDIIGKNFRLFYTEEDQKSQKPDKLLATATKFGKAYDEGWLVRKDGTTFWGSVNITAVHDDEGNVIGFGKLTRDLTERKIAENAALMEVKNKELEQLRYIASHDLQEPLRTVSMYAQVLEEDYAKQLDETAIKYLKAIKMANERMKVLVRSLLDYSKIGQDEVRTFTDCNLLLRDVLEDLLGLIEKTGSKVYVEDLPCLHCYNTELRQVFQSLIINAIKFRREGVSPVIKIGCKKHNQTYVFSVSDNGMGIHPKHFDKIFQMFRRLNRESEFEGHGIGLANCRKILELHGGKIWVESELGKGSVFRFTIDNFQV